MFKCDANNPHIEDGLKESIQYLKFPVSPAALGRIVSSMAVSREACPSAEGNNFHNNL
jgi:hypothetical protein